MQKCTPYFTSHSPNTVIMVKRGLFSLFHVLGQISFSGNSGDFYTSWWTAAFLKRLIYITVPTVEAVTNPYSSKILWADIYDSKTWQLIKFNANTAGRLTVSFIIVIRSTRFQTESFNTIFSSLRAFFFSSFFLYLSFNKSYQRNIWLNLDHLNWPLQSCHSVVTITALTWPGESHHQRHCSCG